MVSWSTCKSYVRPLTSEACAVEYEHLSFFREHFEISRINASRVHLGSLSSADVLVGCRVLPTRRRGFKSGNSEAIDDFNMEKPATLCSGLFSFASAPVEKTMTENRATPSHSAASQVLTQLLSIHSPELGARLKQRLNAAFIASGLGYFDEKSLGFGKFSDYLSRMHGDLVQVAREEGVGDILVSLRPESVKRINLPISTPPSTNARSEVIRNDVWQAFANPDSERRRFLNKETGKIVHFLASKQSPERIEVESAPETFLEILPIATESQLQWMKEFLAGKSLPADEKEVLEGLIAKPYSSAVNVTFTRALGVNSRAWRNFRTERVTSIIHQWLAEKGVAPDKILAQSTDTAVVPVEVPTEAQCKVAPPMHDTTPPAEQFPPRQQVAKLLELLSDDDIIRLVIPTLLSTILIKSRM